MNYVEHINHTELTEPAHASLVKYLESFGNVLSTDHSNALRGLLGLMTDMARGKHTGRFAAGLDTGLGKSSSILIWLAELQMLPGGHNLAVSVAAQRIESLCELKRGLIGLGVPEEMIGLVHTYKLWSGDPAAIPPGYATEPATVSTNGDFKDRPIMLVSHTRVRGTSNSYEKSCLFSHHLGKARALMLFDESLLIAEARQLNLSDFGDMMAAVRGAAGPFNSNSLVPLILPWLTRVETMLRDLFDNKEAGGHATIQLPELPPQTESFLIELMRPTGGLKESVRTTVEAALRTLLELTPYELRLTRRNSGGLLTFEIVVPEELENVLILDASYPIRQLMHEDPSIKDAEQVMVEGGMALSKPLAQLKDYSNVVWHVMRASGGRSSMNKAFANTKRNPRVVTHDIVEVVKAVPKDEAVLLFTYKHKGRKNPDFKADILFDLESHGVDVDEVIAYNGEPRKRINIATWGNETGANAWSHCKHVVMVGILQKDRRLLEGLMAGQRNDLDTPISQKEIWEVIDTESAHLAHQAASRSALRHVVDGKAAPAHIWAIHWRASQLRKHVSKVQAKARWADWNGAYSQTKRSASTIIAERIRDYLLGLPEGIAKVSVRQARTELELTKVPTGTWQRSRDEAMKLVLFDWTIDGRSFMRIKD